MRNQTFVLLGSIYLAFTATNALAQAPPDTAVKVLEGIEVIVGSRAGVADPATLAVPVDIYGAEEIARLGEWIWRRFSAASHLRSTRPASRPGTGRRFTRRRFAA